MKQTFEDWKAEVDAICKKRLGAGWDDLCGDLEPLQNRYAAGDTPREFVDWWGEKYELTFIDELTAGWGQA